MSPLESVFGRLVRLTLVHRVHIAQYSLFSVLHKHTHHTDLPLPHKHTSVRLHISAAGSQGNQILRYFFIRLSVPTAAQCAHRSSVCPPQLMCPPQLSVPTVAQHAHRGSVCPPQLSVPTAAQCAHRGSVCPPTCMQAAAHGH